jgi:hypothetical protein
MVPEMFTLQEGSQEYLRPGLCDHQIQSVNNRIKSITGRVGARNAAVGPSQNAPNPFNTSTKISFSLATDEPVQLIIYDVRGTAVATLVNGSMKAGSYEIQWDAVNAEPGIYFCKLSSADGNAVKRMLLVK